MKVFELYGGNIEFTEKQCNGIALGRGYRCLLKGVHDLFLSFYNDRDQSEEGYWEALNGEILRIINMGIYDGMVEMMKKTGISKKDISNLNYMGIFKYWIPIFERIDYEYNLIFMDVEQAEYYRQIRKEIRGRFVGGGVGIKGALKGMATAGALNVATGTAHSVFNFIGGVKDRVRQLNKIEKLFGNSTKKEILQMFEDTVELAYLTNVEMVKEYGISCKKYRLFYKDKEISERPFTIESLKKAPFNEMGRELSLQIKSAVKDENVRKGYISDLEGKCCGMEYMKKVFDSNGKKSYVFVEECSEEDLNSGIFKEAQKIYEKNINYNFISYMQKKQVGKKSGFFYAV